MQPSVVNHYSVRAPCPDCGGAVAIFDFRDGATAREFGYITTEVEHTFDDRPFARIHYRLLRCAGCQRGGLAKFHDGGAPPATLESFYPRALPAAKLPPAVPEGVVKEYREAELCASVDAARASSALVRSTLEKALKANGYADGSLQEKIELAAADGVITQARKQKAHEDIRVLGNEVVHDEWRAVDVAEVETALHYAQRLLEDLYDDRATVEQLLIDKGRLPSTADGAS